MTELQAGGRTYTWDSNWAKIPSEITLGYTHGVAVDSSGRITVFNQSQHAVVQFNPDGSFAGTWGEFPSDRFLGAHGLSLIARGGQELFWLTSSHSGEVALTTLDGETLLKVEKPDHPIYRGGGNYSPTWATESPTDGTIYVADGYGSSLINRYDKEGKYLDSFDGTEGMGRFACPHGIAFLKRPQATGVDDYVLYVTDRGNSRVQIFDQQLKLLGSFYQDHPCCFDEGPNDELLVPDLLAFINVYDAKDRPIVSRLGENQGQVRRDNWPNVPHDLRIDGKFNSPHGGAMDKNGNIYIVEWVEDGRITKLTREQR